MTDIIERLSREADAWYAGSGGIAALLCEAKAEIEALRKDAARYRWLRGQHWSNSPMCVVANPKNAVKLGFTCPTVEYLDLAIDTAMEKP